MKTTNQPLMFVLGFALVVAATTVRTVCVRATADSARVGLTAAAPAELEPAAASTESLRESGGSVLFRVFNVLLAPLPSRLSR